MVSTATKTAMITCRVPRDQTEGSANQLATADGTVNTSAVGEV